MKKINYILVFIIMLIPTIVSADGTEKYYINATVNTDGSVTFKELVVFEGQYNYLERKLKSTGNTKTFEGNNSNDFYETDIYNAGKIEIDCASDVDKNYVENWNYVNHKNECFTYTSNPVNGMSGYYNLKGSNTDKIIDIYNSSAKNTAFYLEYTVEDLVVVHNDVAELMFNFEWSEEINDYKILVNLPNSSEVLRVFSHGPVNGMNRIDNKSSVSADWSYLGANTITDVRVVFDKTLVPLATKITNVDALDKIVEFETIQADKQNDIRRKSRLLIYGTFTLGILWLIGFIIVKIRFNKKIKEYNKEFSYELYREVPNNYGPDTLGYLLTKDNIKTEYLTASILELIRKKVFTIEQKDKKDFKIILSNTKEKISSSETILVDWLINQVGDGVEFTSKDFKKASKSNYEDFMSSYTLWKDDVIGEAKKYNFYEDISKGKYLLYSFLGLIIFVINIIYSDSLPNLCIALISLFTAIISLITISTSFKRSRYGAEEYAKNQGLKNFMLEFGNMSDKELPEVYLWEKYLVFATSLGIADKVQNVFKVKLQNMNDNDMSYPDYPILYCYHMGIGNNLATTINSSISGAISTATAANTANSSGSGFGGGASFGGGGGGFGGGGGRG